MLFRSFRLSSRTLASLLYYTRLGLRLGNLESDQLDHPLGDPQPHSTSTHTPYAAMSARYNLRNPRAVNAAASAAIPGETAIAVPPVAHHPRDRARSTTPVEQRPRSLSILTDLDGSPQATNTMPGQLPSPAEPGVGRRPSGKRHLLGCSAPSSRGTRAARTASERSRALLSTSSNDAITTVINSLKIRTRQL